MAKDKKLVTNAMRMMDKMKIEYETVEYTADEVGDNFGCEIARITGIPTEKCFKTLVARGDKTGVIVACIPVDCEVDLKKLAKVSGNKRADMIHVKELLSLTGYIRGGVSPIGMKKKYPTFVNDSALNCETVAVSAGICGMSVMIKPSDLQKITDCRFADIIKDLL